MSDMFLYLMLATALLTGLDGYLSYRKMSSYGPGVELNPLSGWVAGQFKTKQHAAIAGTVVFAGLNGVILTALGMAGQSVLVAIWLGAKLGLTAMQLKGLQLEAMIKNLLSEVKKKV